MKKLADLYLGARRWGIYEDDTADSPLSARPVQGITMGWHDRLVVSSTMPPLTRAATLLHEIRHAIDFTYNNGHARDAERCVMCSENGLLELLLNPRNAKVLALIRKWGRAPRSSK